VRHIGESLVKAMQMAKQAGDATGAELVAAECVVLAETKDHANWELLKELCANLEGEEAEVLQAAVDQVEDEEDEHLYHTMGWSRELWLDAMGMEAVFPPPEEEEDVKTAIAAAHARADRDAQVTHTKPARAKEGAGKKAAGKKSAGKTNGARAGTSTRDAESHAHRARH